MDEHYFGLEKKRYETRGINERLPVDYRFLLWTLIDEAGKNMQLDYLQIFQFQLEENEKGEMVQIINHCQEEPEFAHTYEFLLTDIPIEEEIYVIDDGVQCTMLFASEY